MNLMISACLLTREVHDSDDLMSTNLLRKTRIRNGETQEYGGARNAAPKPETRGWLGLSQ
jgi:hypothetical protein